MKVIDPEKLIEQLEEKINKWMIVSGNGPLATSILCDVQDAIKNSLKDINEEYNGYE